MAALTSLLAGVLPRQTSWEPVLALANETLVTPQVYAALLAAGTARQMPLDVRRFLKDVWRRNRARNRRLFAQLHEATTALNSSGIEPMLLKGAGFWAAAGHPEQHDRLLVDIDLLVQPEEIARAVRALEDIGFIVVKRREDADAHVAAELARPGDVAMIDLHRRPPGPSSLVGAAMAWPRQTLQVAWGGAHATVPSPALYIYLLVLHDQYQDGGYWRGEFALRHLLEIAVLSRRPGAVDWTILAALAAGRLAANATNEHLLAAVTLCHAIGPTSAQRPWVGLQHARRRAQFGWPALSPVLRTLAA